jgi:DNA-binding beta-propeller fold protein YncE
MRRSRGTLLAAAAVTLVASPTAAGAQDGPGDDDAGITTVAEGLDGPRQLAEYRHDHLVVAESESGEVSSVDPETGEVTTLLTLTGTPQGVDHHDGLLYVAMGEAAPPPDAPEAAPPPEGTIGSALVVAEPGGEIVEIIDLLAYELDNNPDDQQQFDDAGEPFDALSNPFAVHVQSERILVADAGANDVLAVDRETGEISTFFVPPTVSPEDVPECADAQSNPGTVGCDPVPTGITTGPDGHIYVSTLGAEAPDAARVYVLDHDGDEVDVIEGFTSVAGVEVDGKGRVYAAELLEGAPESGEPPPGFDPATVGRIVRVDADGDRAYSQVTMPTGLEIDDGKLYASAWSIASFVGLDSAGEVVRVGRDSFEDATG